MKADEIEYTLKRIEKIVKQIRDFCVLLIVLTVLLLCGCSSMKCVGYKVNVADPNIIEYYEASYETLFIDWERHGFYGHINGFGSVSSDKSRIESEGAEIAEDVSEVLNPVKGVMP